MNGSHLKSEDSQINQPEEACSVKRLAQLLCALVALFTVSDFAISYIGGRLGCHLAISPFLPAEIVPSLLSFICIAMLFLLQLWSLFKRIGRAAVLTMLLLSLLFASIPWMAVRARVFQIGFRHRITSCLSPEELRQIAVAVTAVMDKETGRCC